MDEDLPGLLRVNLKYGQGVQKGETNGSVSIT